MRKIIFVYFIIILVSLGFSFYFYPILPEKIITHWNFEGKADGYMSKNTGLFLMPGIIAFLTVLFFIIPEIDPLKENIKKFRKYYDNFILLFILFLFLIHLQIILWNLGIKISPNLILSFGFSFLFFYTGILLEKSKRNWFIGIRTPWTLSSDNIWERINRIGSKLFKISGFIALTGIFIRNYFLIFIL
ncbi:MAG: DUF1648 domain-containing protein, partial [bacterium]|nr:DUF1648 domain-containing protein [bacterium]MDW8164450.1 DUF1648 domain-containing protein [Candidatus Omnitrophota bacterium]